MGFLVFLVIIAAILGLIHLYLWQRLVRDTTARRRWRRLGGLGLLAGFVLIFVALLGEPPTPRPYAAWLGWPGLVWLGLMFYLWLALLAAELPVLAVRLVQRWRARRAAADAAGREVAGPDAAGREVAGRDVAGPDAEPVADPARRLLLRRGAALAAGVVALGVGGYGVTRAYGPPRVRRLAVPLARLDPRADGLRVAVIADIHLSPMFGAGSLERVVELVNGLDADLVALVGDLVTSEAGKVRQSAAPLREIRSRYGTFFVTGNHEYYTGHEEWIEAAGDLGMRVLRNQRVEIAHRGGAVDLAGVNDVAGRQYGDPPDYQAALGDRDPTRPVLLLAHQPVQVRQAARYGVDLQLSGHTHGGQLYPFHYLVKLEQPVLSGLSEVDGTQVYVTNGAGYWGPPMRVGADPEVALLELRAAAA